MMGEGKGYKLRDVLRCRYNLPQEFDIFSLIYEAVSCAKYEHSHEFSAKKDGFLRLLLEKPYDSDDEEDDDDFMIDDEEASLIEKELSTEPKSNKVVIHDVDQDNSKSTISCVNNNTVVDEHKKKGNSGMFQSSLKNDVEQIKRKKQVLDVNPENLKRPRKISREEDSMIDQEVSMGVVEEKQLPRKSRIVNNVEEKKSINSNGLSYLRKDDGNDEPKKKSYDLQTYDQKIELSFKGIVEKYQKIKDSKRKVQILDVIPKQDVQIQKKKPRKSTTTLTKIQKTIFKAPIRRRSIVR